ncbi:MAG: hypothetical protein ACRDHW_22830, partial [Ktedonobacteraceae bacterium]
KAHIRQLARQQVPLWLQEMHSVSDPVTPIPSPAFETGPITLPTDTVIIPMIALLPVLTIRDTRELVSAAVLWFYERHRFLPTVVFLNPLRCLAISSHAFFPIECEEIGGYTVEIQQAACLGCDVVWLSYEGIVEDSYLCVL